MHRLSDSKHRRLQGFEELGEVGVVPLPVHRPSPLAGVPVLIDRGEGMRNLAARHTTVHLGMPDLRGVVARIDSEQRNEDAKG